LQLIERESETTQHCFEAYQQQLGLANIAGTVPLLLIQPSLRQTETVEFGLGRLQAGLPATWPLARTVG